MTENLRYLSQISSDVDNASRKTSWKATVADFLLHEEHYGNPSGFNPFTHVLLPPTKPKKEYFKPHIAKEVKITEARKFIREEKFQQVSKGKQDRIIQHELAQVRENLENDRFKQKIQLEDIEELSNLQRKRRETSCKTRVTNSSGHSLVFRPSNYANDMLSMELMKPYRNRLVKVLGRESGENNVEDVQLRKIDGRTKKRTERFGAFQKEYEKMKKISSNSSLLDNTMQNTRKLESQHLSTQNEAKILTESTAAYEKEYKIMKKARNPDKSQRNSKKIENLPLTHAETNERTESSGAYHKVYSTTEKVSRNPSSHSQRNPRKIDNQPLPTQRDIDERKDARDFERRVRLINTYFEHRLKKNFFRKWKELSELKKSEQQEEKIWQEKIDIFMKRLNAISEAKKEIAKQDNKGQRTKTAPILPSHKNRKVIESYHEIKDTELQKISKEVEKSTLETRQKLRSKALSLDPMLRGKAKLIRVFTAVINKNEALESDKNLQFPEPKFLLEMEQKQKERKERLKELQEKRRCLEEEKIERTKQKMERQLREEEEEKKRKLRQFREKVRLEKIEQERRKQEWMRLKSLTNKAAQYYKYKLLTKYGLFPWMKLIQERKKQMAKAEKQNIRRIKRQVLTIWKSSVDEIIEEKGRKAILHWRRSCLRHCLCSWERILIERHVQNQVAEDWHDYFIVSKALQKWQAFIFIEQFEFEQKWKIAVMHFKRKEAIKYLKHWMLLPQVLYLEREKEIRKQEWRQKVQQVLPDFRPTPSQDI